MRKSLVCICIAPLLLSCLLSTLVLLTLGDYGVAWDEGYYIYSGIFRCNWLADPSLETVDRYWREVHEHTPLPQVLAGATERLFNQKLHLLNRISSARVSSVLFVFALTYALFSFARELYGTRTAFLVTLSFFFLPRVFYHSHLATADYAMTAMWFLVAYAYWKGFRQRGWIFASSVLMGFALLTKIHAVLIYIPLLLYWALYQRGRKSRSCARPRSTLLPLLIIPPVIFVAFWPWLWKDIPNRTAEYLAFYLRHADIPVYYLGETYYSAPWHYPFVMTIVTLPLAVSVPLLIGLLTTGTGKDGKTDAFILCNALVPLLAIAVQVAKYDGVRLFLPAFPFLCLVAGRGIERVMRFAGKRRLAGPVFWGYAALLAVTVYFSVFRIHPYQSSYFNAAVGGTRGAARMGFEPEYWGNAYVGLLEWMNERPDKVYWLYMAERDPNLHLNIRLYKESGLMKREIAFGGRESSDYLVLLARPGMFTGEMWFYYLYGEPVFSVKLSGTELANIYELK